MADRRFQRFAWFYVAYLIGVILFGAWVRITGSGDGCGNHWPACNGSVIPPAPQAKTIIEYSHRLSTALCGIFAVVLLLWSRRVSRPVARAAAGSFVFLIVESLLGALLVKRHLVVDNASAERAIVVALHLANTLMLSASAALVAWRATVAQPLPISVPRATRPLLGAALGALLVTNMAGAVTALGDTLFPTKPALDAALWAKLRADASAGEHFLVRLRVIHPLVALVAAVIVLIVLLYVLSPARERSLLTRLALASTVGVALQMALGFVNVLLAAPGWLQVVHLAAAQIVWLLVWLVYQAACQRPELV
jgi:heme A synthase